MLTISTLLRNQNKERKVRTPTAYGKLLDPWLLLEMIAPELPGRQFRMDERGNAIPYSWVVFNLVVGLIEYPGKPLVVTAIDAQVVIGHLKVAQNHRS